MVSAEAAEKKEPKAWDANNNSALREMHSAACTWQLSNSQSSPSCGMQLNGREGEKNVEIG